MISIGPGTYDIEWDATVTTCPMEDSTTSNSSPGYYEPAVVPIAPPPLLREEVWPIRPRKDLRVGAQRTPVLTVKQGFFLHRQ